ncbi:MAG: hypothetical protein FJ319_10580 [SAR202 cluster bacterium]|nr:hypothetical protein [SAR202 cluster bacterium]
MAAGEMTAFESPIDVMLAIHKALSAEAARVQGMVESLQPGESLQPLRLAFNGWASQLMYHAEVEDRLMTGPIDSPAARTNEAEHQVLGRLEAEIKAYWDSRNAMGLETQLREAIRALHEEQHLKLMEKLEDVLGALNDEVGKTRLVARTKRYIYGKVVELRITQDDHFESEEAFVLPYVRERMGFGQQALIARSLLVDEGSDTPDWVMGFVTERITESECAALKAYVASLPQAVKA